MTARVKPWHDCPPCRSCGAAAVVPIRPTGETSLTTDRWHGPNDATLWCPACGDGWRHETVEEFVQADRAYHAWERKQGRDDAKHRRLKKAAATVDLLKQYERTWGKQ